MYIMTCDGYPLLDTHNDDYILGSPRVKNEVNTVGEGSFKIYSNHPNIDKLTSLKSIFEVKDEYGVIFRGRMTENTKDINNGKDVDLEGVMAFFNDSVVRPYVFPDDFEEDAEYQAAASESAEQAALDGGVVRFYLKWLIERHNEQVESFQRFKLGNVTVYDKNNHIERDSSIYPSTWKELSDKTFNSSLGGYLCIRYESDGNYIDYLREFTGVNEQGITYGENMLDISQNTNASGTYSAIIPFGAETSQSNGDVYEGMYGDIVGGATKPLTIESLPDGNITDDIVKEGDMLYSIKARAAYGLRIAPREETTWEDVEVAENLQTKGVEFLEGNSTKIPNTIKVTAVDLNCTDSQIRSFRIYKKIPVHTTAHGISENFDLTALDIDLLNPQNTKITVGKTVFSFTEQQTKQQNYLDKILGSYATTQRVVNGFQKTETLIEKSSTDILLKVSQEYATSETLKDYVTNETLKDYSTTKDVESKIVAGIDGIDLSVYAKETEVSKTLESYATNETLKSYAKTTEVESKISAAVGGINLSVYATKTELKDYAKTSEVSAQISLAVDTDALISKINLAANQLIINSDNFTLTADGKIKATNGEFSGIITATNGGQIGNWSIVEGSLSHTDKATWAEIKISPTELYTKKYLDGGLDYETYSVAWADISSLVYALKDYKVVLKNMASSNGLTSNYTIETSEGAMRFTFKRGLLTSVVYA